MKSEIKVLGKQELMGKEIRVIEGGFGENQKVMLASDIAEMHEVETKYINKLINNNARRFNDNDLMDLKNCGSSKELQFEEMGLSKMKVSKAKNIYALSERGYMKLTSMMDNSSDKKFEVIDTIIENYFTMKQVIDESKQNHEKLVDLVKDTMSAIMPVITTQIVEKFAPVIVETKQQVDNMTNLLHDQSEIYDNDRNNIKSLIGFKSANTKRIVNTIKDMLSERYGYKIYASNDIFVKVKRRVFKRFEVIKWEDIPVERFNEVYAFVDTYIEDLKISC